MDNRLIKFLRNDSISFLKFADDDLPERILDLGCGVGVYWSTLVLYTHMVTVRKLGY